MENEKNDSSVEDVNDDNGSQASDDSMPKKQQSKPSYSTAI